MKTLFDILLFLWQLPQNLLGLILWSIYAKGSYSQVYRGIRVVVNPKFKGGISLGNIILVDCDYKGNANTWNHEWGHTIQSRILGPLYLFIVGIPSFIWACLYGTKLFPYKRNGYYKVYPENWADKLGGVIRK